MAFVGNLVLFPAVEDFWKSVITDKVIAMSMYYFFGGHSVYYIFCIQVSGLVLANYSTPFWS